MIFFAHLSPLHLLGCHDNDSWVLLKHHPPEVTDGVLQTALSGDVALLHLCAVTLWVQLRLRTHRDTRTVGWILKMNSLTADEIKTEPHTDWQHMTTCTKSDHTSLHFITIINYSKVQNKCVCMGVWLRKKWVYHDGRYYHDDIGVDIVRARLIWVPVIQHHTCVVDCKQKQKQHGFKKSPLVKMKACYSERAVRVFLTGQNVLVSVLVFVLCSLALFATVEQLALLLLQGLD